MSNLFFACFPILRKKNFKLSTKLNNGFNFSAALSKEIQEKFNVRIDPSVLRKIRREDNFVYRRVRGSPKLDDTDKAARFIWCMVTNNDNFSILQKKHGILKAQVYFLE
jgi:hypothetical protein